jgi:glycosyltransferase involved in cell wall biosynthesis
MRVAVASTFVPFIKGGGRMIVDDLVAALRERGHEVDTVLIPFDSTPREQLEQMLALRLMRIGSEVERLICIRTPSYLLQHPNKVVWFIHHHRGAYDLWGTKYQDIPDGAEGLAIRDAIRSSDDLSLREARALFTNSAVVRDRLREFNNLDGEVLYPPLMDTHRFLQRQAENYIFYPSRITEHKRQWLGVEAMRHVRSDVRLIVAGAPDSPEQLERLRRTAAEAAVGDRVEILARWISEEEKADLLSRALGVMYVPFDEDSYGYPSLEAYHSGKPVISCTDSGGTREIVEHGVTGLMTEPTPEALAEAIDRLHDDAEDAERMGRAGRARIDALNISWDHVVSRLLA